MSEIKKVLKDTLPSKIYLDTAYLIDVLVETKENPLRHKKAVEFSKKLQQSKTTIICSRLSYIEFWSAAFTNRPDLKIRESIGIYGLGSRIHEKAREAAIKYRLPIYGNSSAL